MTKTEYKDYISENGTYLIPVTWEVYSTIRVKADNLGDAIQKAQEHIDEIPLNSYWEYIDGSYMLDVDSDLIMAQEYRDLGDKVLEFD